MATRKKEYIKDGVRMMKVSDIGYPFMEHEYRIAEKAPRDFVIWNIGTEHMPEGYVPLCRLSAYERFHIDVSSLIAVKTDHQKLLMDATSIGGSNIHETEKRIRRLEKNPKRAKDVELLKKALLAMGEIFY